MKEPQKPPIYAYSASGETFKSGCLAKEELDDIRVNGLKGQKDNSHKMGKEDELRNEQRLR